MGFPACTQVSLNHESVPTRQRCRALPANCVSASHPLVSARSGVLEYMKYANRQNQRRPKRPFENLLPVVRLLISSGNVLLDGGFILDPDGWRCRLRDPINFKLIAAQCQLPLNVEGSPAHDSILDRLTWCVIEGPELTRNRR